MKSLNSIIQVAKKLNGHICLQTEEPGQMTALLYLPASKDA
jgi:hypothetical protein